MAIDKVIIHHTCYLIIYGENKVVKLESYKYLAKKLSSGWTHQQYWVVIIS